MTLGADVERSMIFAPISTLKAIGWGGFYGQLKEQRK
jgi:hypothetical protein